MSTFDSAHLHVSPAAALNSWASLDQQKHVVQFYADDAYLVDELSRFVGTALGGGGAAIVVCTKAHADGLAVRLRSLGFDLSRAIENGRYVQLDAEDTLARFMVDDWPDAGRFGSFMEGVIVRSKAAGEGENPPIAAFGEMVALLWAQGKPEAAIRLEELWNELGRTHSFCLRCAYPISGFSDDGHSEAFGKICAQHSAVMPDETYTALAGDEERLRTIAQLQQRSQVLEKEIEKRKQVEEDLRRSKADLETLVEQRTIALQRLSSRLLGLQDIERRRLARELHDTIGQYLAALKLNVNVLRKAPGRQELWAESEELMKLCISEVRTLSYLLHPPTMEEVGFGSAAQWYVKGFSERSGVKVGLDVPGNLDRLPEEIEVTLFRVLQETLNNVHQHSQASSVDVVVQRSDAEVLLEVRDNGKGMSQDLVRVAHSACTGMGVGLMSIRERVRQFGGTFRLESSERGTSVRVTLPVSLEPAH